MKNYNRLLCLLLAPFLFIFSACTFIEKKEIKEYDYSSMEVSQITYEDINLSQDYRILPSTGELNILVLPIEFKNDLFPTNYKDCINRVFNGSSDKNSDLYTGYGESVKSFYYKSSYGKLDLNFTIADKYYIDKTARQWATSDEAKIDGEVDNGVNLIGKAYDNYKSNNDVLNFDSNTDGYIDGIVAIYSAKDYASGDYTWDSEEYYWAYCYWASVFDTPYAESNLSNPGFDVYFFASYYFIFENTKSPAVDYHTMAHEFGHMLGLDDYYSSDSDYGFNPMGGIVMEDFNICDHDMFTKIILGWVDPLVGNTSGTVTISSSGETGDAILIPSSAWNETAFDEYILIEFYTPTYLNELDSKTKYSTRPLGLTDYGIKIYHIDARLLEIKNKRYSYATIENQKLKSNITYMLANTNCNKNIVYGDIEHSLCHMIEADNNFDFYRGSTAENNDLFKAGDTFTISNYQRFFPNYTKLNNNTSFDYTISIDSIDSTSATISITK